MMQTCGRGNCENICCSRHSDRYGYLCDDCREELIVVLRQGGNIPAFMQSPSPEAMNRDQAQVLVASEFELI